MFQGTNIRKTIMIRDFNISGVISAVVDKSGKIIFITQDRGENNNLIQTLTGKDFFGEFIPERDRSNFKRFFLEFIYSNESDSATNGRLMISGSFNEKVKFVLRKIQDEEMNMLGCHITISKLKSEEGKSGRDEERVISPGDRERLQNEYLGIVTHELRTPINAIIGFTEQLSKTDLTQKQTDYVQILNKSSERLLSLVNDLLVLSKIETGKLKLDNEPFTLGNILKEIFSMLKPKAAEKNLKFTYKINDHLSKMILTGDPLRIRQIIFNITDIAIKFTNEGYIEIACRDIERGSDSVLAGIAITSGGTGINGDFAGNVFEQLESRDFISLNKFSGSRLDLAVIKKLINHLGGTMKNTRLQNNGYRFNMVIPFKAGKEGESLTDETSKTDPSIIEGKRILIVDDDSVNCFLSKVMIEGYGGVVETAVNGTEAIDKVRKKTYDLILLDIHLPGHSGIKVAEFIRQRLHDEKVRIIAVTAAAFGDDVDNYLLSGFNDYIIKPYKETVLFNKIYNIFIRDYDPVKFSESDLNLKPENMESLYNLQELRKITRNDSRLLANMLGIFIRNSQDSIRNFNNFLKEKDWKNIGETAHKILPSYRHLEVDSVVSDLVRIKERTLITGNNEGVSELVSNVTKSMAKIVTMLKSELKKLQKVE